MARTIRKVSKKDSSPTAESVYATMKDMIGKVKQQDRDAVGFVIWVQAFAQLPIRDQIKAFKKWQRMQISKTTK